MSKSIELQHQVLNGAAAMICVVFLFMLMLIITGHLQQSDTFHIMSTVHTQKLTFCRT